MSRIEALRRLHASRPDDLRIQFGLALEYLEAGRTEEGVELLEDYLERADDEGNGWGRLARAHVEEGRIEEARKAYRAGIEAARRHGHPTMAEEFEADLADLADVGDTRDVGDANRSGTAGSGSGESRGPAEASSSATEE